MTIIEIAVVMVFLAVTCIGGLIGHLWGSNAAIGAIFTPTILYASMLALFERLDRRAQAKRLPLARVRRRAA
jgi:hypothetical protein